MRVPLCYAPQDDGEMILAPAVSFMYAYRAYRPQESAAARLVKMFAAFPKHRASDLVDLINSLTFKNQLRVFEFSGCGTTCRCGRKPSLSSRVRAHHAP